MNHTRLVAKVIIKNQNEEILLLRRSATDTLLPGGLDFPGGGAEHTESLIEAAIRETQEEVGITLDKHSLKLAYAQTSYKDSTSTLRALCIARIDYAPKIALSYEHDEFWWRRPEEVVGEFDDIVWSEGLQYILDHDLL